MIGFIMSNLTNWITYNGSDEQIAEMREACKVAGFIYRYRLKNGKLSSQCHIQFDLSFLRNNELDIPAEYLICKRHPLMHMIMQQSQTGQPVWIRYVNRYKGDAKMHVISTNHPDWNIPNAEYSFMEFE